MRPHGLKFFGIPWSRLPHITKSWAAKHARIPRQNTHELRTQNSTAAKANSASGCQALNR